jgi:D-alanyl-D-alanine carboxypeptidase
MKFSLSLKKGIFALLLLIAAQYASAQQIKDKPVGKLALKLIEAINSGNKDAQIKFIRGHIDMQAQRNGETAEDILKNFTEIYAKTGSVEIVSMQEGRDPDEVQLSLKPKNGSETITMFTHLSRESDDMLIGFVIRPSGGPAPNGPPQVNSPAPFKEVTLLDALNEIKQRINKAVSENKFSGTVLLARKGDVFLNQAYGIADADKQLANNANTKFNLGSINKMFTGVAIAQLVQAGKLSFDDKLIKILPDYPNKEAASKITIAQLLTHTSGLGDFFKPEFFDNMSKFVDLKDYLPLYANEPLQFEPGKGWAYSNAGFITLGLVIEKVSGEDYFSYVHKHIFMPAGMTNTDWYKKDASVPNLAKGYTYGREGQQQTQPRNDNLATLPVRGSSAGGGYSTTGDMLRFTQALLGNKLLSAEYTQTVMAGKVDDHHPNSKYAYGFMDRVQNGHHIIGHNGGGPGINGYVMMLDNGYTVIVLSNFDPPAADALGKGICDQLAAL